MATTHLITKRQKQQKAEANKKQEMHFLFISKRSVRWLGKKEVEKKSPSSLRLTKTENHRWSCRVAFMSLFFCYFWLFVLFVVFFSNCLKFLCGQLSTFYRAALPYQLLFIFKRAIISFRNVCWFKKCVLLHQEVSKYHESSPTLRSKWTDLIFIAVFHRNRRWIIITLR